MIEWLRKQTRPYRWLYKMLAERRWLAEEVPFAQIHFSQCGEDLVLQSLFAGQEFGRWIDVGAFDPFLFSNTYALYKRGWSGINIEPNPRGYAKIASARHRDVNINAAVGNGEGKFAEFFCSGPWSSLTRSNAERSGGLLEKVTVPVVSLQDVAERHDCLRPEILSVDCEGHDIEVLKSANWERFRPRCVVVEDEVSGEESEIHQFLVLNGYKMLIHLGLSKIFIPLSDQQWELRK